MLTWKIATRKLSTDVIRLACSEANSSDPNKSRKLQLDCCRKLVKICILASLCTNNQRFTAQKRQRFSKKSRRYQDYETIEYFVRTNTRDQQFRCSNPTGDMKFSTWIQNDARQNRAKTVAKVLDCLETPSIYYKLK